MDGGDPSVSRAVAGTSGESLPFTSREQTIVVHPPWVDPRRGTPENLGLEGRPTGLRPPADTTSLGRGLRFPELPVDC